MQEIPLLNQKVSWSLNRGVLEVMNNILSPLCLSPVYILPQNTSLKEVLVVSKVKRTVEILKYL